MIGYAKQKVKNFWAALTLLSVELIIILTGFFGALFLFVFLVKMIFLQNRQGFDEKAFYFMSRIVSSISTNVMEVFSFLGTHLFLIPANFILICYFFFIKKHRWYSIRVPAIALSSMTMMFFLKSMFQRARPDMPLIDAAKGLSFPSGHATMSVTFYGLIIYTVYRNKALSFTTRTIVVSLLILLILMIGASRVYLRVHYASDVIAGFCFGFLWLVFSIWILKKIEIFSRKRLDTRTK